MEVEAPARDENEPELSESSSSSENASCGDSVSAMKSIPMELLSWASNNRATSSSMSTKPLPNGCVNNLLSSTIVRKEDEEESSSESPPDFLKLPGQTNSKYVEAMTNSLKRELLLEQSVKGSPCSDDSTGTGDDSKSAPRRSNRILLTKPKRESRRQQTVPASPSTVIESPSQASEGYVINGDLLDRLNIDDSAFLDEYENKSPQELFDDLPIVGLKKPPFFEPIAERIALSKGKGRKSKSGKAHMDCDCSPDDLEPGEAGCGDNCLNRMLMIECSDQCSLGPLCTNKSFTKRMNAKLEVFDTVLKGFGLRAAESIPGGTFIMEYVGELLNERQFKTRVKDAAKKGHEHFYFMALTNDAIIDATYKGNVSRFINHSCEPNSETQKWTVNGDLRVGFFSTRKIAPGEEITFDYKFERYGRAAQKCLCGSAKCRGYIGGGDEGDEESGDEDDSDDEETPTQTPVPTPPSTPAQSPPGQQPKKDQTPKKPRERVYRDRELEAQFRRLKKTGLQTKDHVLRCSRLMIRDLTQKKKMDVLEMIREAPISCQKLFLDFHGLRLLWTWLVERGKESKQFHILLREILTTLDVLPIPYLNGLKSSRVLEFVERISGVVFVQKHGKVLLQSHVALKPSDQTNTMGNESSEMGVDDVKFDDEDDDDDDESMESQDKLLKGDEEVRAMAKMLLEKWRDLQELYKIPRKLRRDSPERPPAPEDESDRQRIKRESEWEKQREIRWKEKRERERRWADMRAEQERHKDPLAGLSKAERRRIFEEKARTEQEKREKIAQQRAAWQALQAKFHEKLIEDITIYRSLCFAAPEDPDAKSPPDDADGPPVGACYDVPDLTELLGLPPPPYPSHFQAIPPYKLPSGWFLHLTTTGNLYYFHPDTCTVSWYPPPPQPSDESDSNCSSTTSSSAVAAAAVFLTPELISKDGEKAKEKVAEKQKVDGVEKQPQEKKIEAKLVQKKKPVEEKISKKKKIPGEAKNLVDEKMEVGGDQQVEKKEPSSSSPMEVKKIKEEPCDEPISKDVVEINESDEKGEEAGDLSEEEEDGPKISGCDVSIVGEGEFVADPSLCFTHGEIYVMDQLEGMTEEQAEAQISSNGETLTLVNLGDDQYVKVESTVDVELETSTDSNDSCSSVELSSSDEEPVDMKRERARRRALLKKKRRMERENETLDLVETELKFLETSLADVQKILVGKDLEGLCSDDLDYVPTAEDREVGAVGLKVYDAIDELEFVGERKWFGNKLDEEMDDSDDYLTGLSTRERRRSRRERSGLVTVHIISPTHSEDSDQVEHEESPESSPVLDSAQETMVTAAEESSIITPAPTTTSFVPSPPLLSPVPSTTVVPSLLNRQSVLPMPALGSPLFSEQVDVKPPIPNENVVAEATSEQPESSSDEDNVVDSLLPDDEDEMKQDDSDDQTDPYLELASLAGGTRSFEVTRDKKKVRRKDDKSRRLYDEKGKEDKEKYAKNYRRVIESIGENDELTSEQETKVKDAFHKDTAKYIVSLLTPYRALDCKQGKIRSTLDFKHLARKLTYAVVSKELQNCRNLRNLRFHEGIRVKTKAYVKKYMTKQGPIYQKSPTQSK